MLSSILEQSKAHVVDLFEATDTTELSYHNFQHTEEVVARSIFLSSNMEEEAQLLVQIAAWFHDVGYLQAYDHHEERGMRIATDYLSNKGLTIEQIQCVVHCIEATKPPFVPRTALESIIKDADLGFGVTENFFETGTRLRREWEIKLNRHYENDAWEILQLDFLSNVQFYSVLGKQHYQAILEKNRLKQTAKIKNA